MRAIYSVLFVLVGFTCSSQSLMNLYFSDQTTQQLALSNIDSITYMTAGLGSAPLITTMSPQSADYFNYLSGGSVAYEGGSTIVSRGVCWNNDGSPTVFDNSSTGSNTTDFITIVGNVVPGEVYFIRAYAINATDTAYGNEESFEVAEILPCEGEESVLDAAGNNYATRQIGEQCWMASNLRTTAYANGDPLIAASNAEEFFSTDDGAWCWYQDNNDYDDPYGKMYNPKAVQDDRNVCPVGWHVPSEEDWITLMQSIDVNLDYDYDENYIVRSSMAGLYLQSTDFSGFESPNNYTGLGFWLGGLRAPLSDIVGFYLGIDAVSQWYASNPEIKFMMDTAPDIRLVISEEEEGFLGNGSYIRCVRDE